MKEIIEILMKKRIIFKKFYEIDKKRLNTRKKIRIFEGVDLKSYYNAVFFIEQKSRFLTKNAEEIENLYKKLIDLQDHNFKKKIFLHSSPLCSKAKEILKKRGWRIFSDFV